jgi:hypothetical protein
MLRSLSSLGRFPRNMQIQNFVKIHPVIAEVFRTDGRTYGKAGMMKLIGARCNFAKSPYNRTPVHLLYDTLNVPTPTAVFCRSKCQVLMVLWLVVLTTRTEDYNGCAVCRGKILTPSFRSICLFVLKLWGWTLTT